MDIVRVRYFLAVCEHGSFTAAAKACGVSQPSVTTGVARLERAIGGRLFERRHPVRLTPLGAELRPLLEDLQSVADQVAAAVGGARGHGFVLDGNNAGLLGRGATVADASFRCGRGADVEIRLDNPDKPDLIALSDRWLDLQRRSEAAITRAKLASELFQSVISKDDEVTSRATDGPLSD